MTNPILRKPTALKQASRWYYGWVMAPLATLMMIGTGPGQTYGVAVFNPSISESLKLSNSALSGAYMLASLLAAVPMPFIGVLSDRIGLKRTSFLMVLGLGLACAVTSFAGGIVMLVLGFLMLRTFGQGALHLVANNTAAMWFSRRLGLVTGFMGVGVSASVAVFPRIYLELIQSFGWREAYLLIGAGTCLILCPPIVLLYRNRPEDVGQRIDHQKPVPVSSSETSSTVEVIEPTSLTLQEAFRTRAYWIAMGLNMANGMIGTGIFFHIVQLFENRGLTSLDVTHAFSTFAICFALAHIVGGWLADSVRPSRLMSVGSFGVLIAVVTLWGMNSIAMAHLYAGLLGLSQGVLVTVLNTIWPRYFGLAHLGKIRSSVWTAVVAGCSVGPFIMGLSADLYGDFVPSLALFVGVLAVVGVAGLFATPPRTVRRTA